MDTVGLAITLDQIINSYRNKVKTIRQQRCKQCWTTLAIEASDKIGHSGEYYIIDGGLIVKGDLEPYYRKSGRWFGNHVRCPKCGLEGKLPGDKPLNWDQMQKERELGHV